MRRLMGVAVALACAVVLVLAVGALVLPTSPAGAHGAHDDPAVPEPVVPVLAYYYIWYTSDSWSRAKTDLPQLGTYSSDDAEVMRQHVRTAKAAGITGFLVSWKDTEALSRRLRQLIDIARSEEFKLAINYEGLDFHRDPLPVEQVQADLLDFATRYALDPVFRIFDKPLVVWSGSPKASREDIARVAAPVRDSIRLLASQRSAEDYRRVADLVDGNAYYWSSADTARDAAHAGRLDALGTAVHETGGLWIAPFAPGFDARLVGGTRVVDRRDGAQLNEQHRAALSSSPDALGLISWNEFSENTHVEPSRVFGDRYIRLVADLAGGAPLPVGEQAVDSSDSVGAPDNTGLWVLGGTVLVLGVAVAVLVGRRLPGAGRGTHGGAVPGRQGIVHVRTAVLAVVPVGLAVTLIVSMTATAEPPAAPAPRSLHHRGAMPVRDAGAVVVAAAGDIACAADSGGRGREENRQPGSCQDAATAGVLAQIDPDAVLALGDLQYPNGSLERFRGAYELTWGGFRDRTYPAVGNHEYSTPGATGYFDFFGPAAGSTLTGYYSYDLGSWHVVALNSECDQVAGCEIGSPQERWLRADLAAHPTRCTLVYWHQPRFSSGKHGSKVAYGALWQAAYDAGADIVLSAHDHNYERFAPLTAGGQLDLQSGIRSFVVGTGGSTLYRFHDVAPGSEVRLQDVYGVLSLTLRPDDFAWEFVGVPGSGAIDSGAGRCH